MVVASAPSRTGRCSCRAVGVQQPVAGGLPTLAQRRHSASFRSTPLKGSTLTVLTAQSRVVQTDVATEVFELADRGSFIGGTAATMFAMTLIGLAIGFVLLRVEALAEEGKI